MAGCKVLHSRLVFVAAFFFRLNFVLIRGLQPRRCPFFCHLPAPCLSFALGGENPPPGDRPGQRVPKKASPRIGAWIGQWEVASEGQRHNLENKLPEENSSPLRPERIGCSDSGQCAHHRLSLYPLLKDTEGTLSLSFFPVGNPRTRQWPCALSWPGAVSVVEDARSPSPCRQICVGQFTLSPVSLLAVYLEASSNPRFVRATLVLQVDEGRGRASFSRVALLCGPTHSVLASA